MARRLLQAAVVAVVLAVLYASPASAHEGEEGAGITCEPNQVTAGGTVVLAGTGLEPASERQINLVGTDVIVPFGTVTTDAEGMFSVTLTVPSHLPAGTYAFQAIGDETLTTDLAVIAAAGQAPVEPGSEAADLIAPRERSPLEIGLWAVLILLAFGAGALLVARAERFGRPVPPRRSLSRS